MLDKKKFIYTVSRALTKEQVHEALNEVSAGNLQTMEYLQKLNSAPNFHDFTPHCFIRYKG